MRLSKIGALAVVAVAALLASIGGCGSSGGSGDAVTFSCNQSSASICVQILVPSSELSAEQSTCTNVESGTPGTGCPTTGLIGCCKQTIDVGTEDECYYDASLAMMFKASCKGTWSTTP
jgi:hypothetical protein